jgi:hypothetical protein
MLHNFRKKLHHSHIFRDAAFFVLQVDYIEPLIFTRLGKVGDGEDAGVPESRPGHLSG